MGKGNENKQPRSALDDPDVRELRDRLWEYSLRKGVDLNKYKHAARDLEFQLLLLSIIKLQTLQGTSKLLTDHGNITQSNLTILHKELKKLHESFDEISSKLEKSTKPSKKEKWIAWLQSPGGTIQTAILIGIFILIFK